MKKILFKAHSPFTIFTCAVIGELYYKEDYKILIMGNPIEDGFRTRARNADFFQEIILFDQRDKSVRQIENTVDSFLEDHTQIDEYFMCVFSDGYSMMLAYRLMGRAKLNIFPEGCAALQLKERIALVFQEVYGKDALLRRFFCKYPIDLALFSETWVFDENMDQGDFQAKKRVIEIRKLLFGQEQSKITERLNILYGYHQKENYDIFILDDTLAGSDHLDGLAEMKIFDVLFSFLKEKRILVKSHPGQDLLLSKLRFGKYGVDFFDQPDIPWEIMLINLMKDHTDGITVITPLLATSVMSTINLFAGCTPVTVISLHLLEQEYFSDYIKKAIRLNHNYYEQAVLNTENIRLSVPRNFHELAECFRDKKEVRTENREYSMDKPSDYFARVGNMLSKASVFSEDGQFFASAYFYFLSSETEIVFQIEKDINMEEFVWCPSTCHLFSAVSNLTVEIDNGCNAVQAFRPGELRTNHFFENGKMSCRVRYKGYCKTLLLRCRLVTEHKYCALSWLYQDCRWRGQFWERWYEIEKNGLLKKFAEKLTLKKVWIFGYAKIGQAIRNGFESCQVETTLTASGTFELDGCRMAAVGELYRQEKLPDIMIITPMNDYDLICFGLPDDLKSVTLGLDAFLSRVTEE